LDKDLANVKCLGFPYGYTLDNMPILGTLLLFIFIHRFITLSIRNSLTLSLQVNTYVFHKYFQP